MSAPDFVIPPDHPSATAAIAPDRASPLDAVCDAAVERLKASLPGKVRVEHFPDKPEDFDFEGFEAAALVLYDGGDFDAAGARGEQGVAEEVRLVVVLMVRSLRGPNGSNRLLEEIRLALHGHSLAGMTGLRPLKRELEREGSGVFQYSFAFAGRLPALPGRAAAAGLALPRSFDRR